MLASCAVPPSTDRKQPSKDAGHSDVSRAIAEPDWSCVDKSNADLNSIVAGGHGQRGAPGETLP